MRQQAPRSSACRHAATAQPSSARASSTPPRSAPAPPRTTPRATRPAACRGRAPSAAGTPGAQPSTGRRRQLSKQRRQLRMRRLPRQSHERDEAAGQRRPLPSLPAQTSASKGSQHTLPGAVSHSPAPTCASGGGGWLSGMSIQPLPTDAGAASALRTCRCCRRCAARPPAGLQHKKHSSSARTSIPWLRTQAWACTARALPQPALSAPPPARRRRRRQPAPSPRTSP